ncbi:hypothetical protein JTB14_037323 [Gonioctena quinquepunctata]|nr:hypothetical protein JTB14_037323 [Gonioctena quinquepunctata]
MFPAPLSAPEEAGDIKQKFRIYIKNFSRNIVTGTKICLSFGCRNSEGFFLTKPEVGFVRVVLELRDLEASEFFTHIEHTRNVAPIDVTTKYINDCFW